LRIDPRPSFRALPQKALRSPKEGSCPAWNGEQHEAAGEFFASFPLSPAVHWMVDFLFLRRNGIE
jgi:hypothetical protein